METKTVKLTLEQARELYNQGGNFKTIALGAYSEKELIEPILPNTWEEFCENSSVKDTEYFINNNSEIIQAEGEKAFVTRGIQGDKNILPNKETAEAMLALMQLIQLRDCYNQGWKPDWGTYDIEKYTITYELNIVSKNKNYSISHVMAFKTEELRDKFFDNFKELLEQAKELL